MPYDPYLEIAGARRRRFLPGARPRAWGSPPTYEEYLEIQQHGITRLPVEEANPAVTSEQAAASGLDEELTEMSNIDLDPGTQSVPFGANGGWHDSAQQAELDRQVHREQLAREGFLGTRAEAEAEVNRRIAEARGVVAAPAEVTELVTEPAPVADVAVATVPETVTLPATPVA